MAGRIYKIRSRRPVNRFTWEDYGNFCTDIKGANPVNKSVLVTVTKGRTSLAANISQVLKRNNISTVSYNKHMGSNKVVRMVFSNNSDAQKAADIINLMATPDSITESNIHTDGTVVSDYGVNVKVDTSTNPDGTVTATSGGNYVSTAQAASEGTVAGDSETGDLSRWLVIGGLALLAVIIVIAVWKKMSK